MSTFTAHLAEIDRHITFEASHFHFVYGDFVVIRDHVLRIMCALDRAFACLLQGTLLTGSIPLNLRIHSPTEFDVLLQLCYPYQNLVDVLYIPACPGFLQLNYKKAMQHLRGDVNFATIRRQLAAFIDPKTNLLCRKKLIQWIRQLFEMAMWADGKQVLGTQHDVYSLTYKQRGIAHTIYANCKGGMIKIDFVPVIMMQPGQDCRDPLLYATPRGAFYSSPYIHEHSFFICNPHAEIMSFQSAPINVLIVGRLLKYMCREQQIPRFKSYFIVTALLWELQKQPTCFWFQPLDIVFLHMLYTLLQYFVIGYMPFFWNSQFNLLCYLTRNECNETKNILSGAFYVMRNYPLRGKLVQAST